MSERKSYGLLKGKKGIVFGPFDESSLGWHIAVAAHREGAEVVVSNIAVAARFGKVKQLSEQLGTPLILCDVTNMDELNAAFTELKEKVGSVDFIVHAVGMSQNIRKERPYEDLNYDWFIKTLDVSAISLHRILSTALKHDAINDFGSVLTLSYIAAQRNYWTYSDMGDAKPCSNPLCEAMGHAWRAAAFASTPFRKAQPKHVRAAGLRTSTRCSSLRTCTPHLGMPQLKNVPTLPCSCSLT